MANPDVNMKQEQYMKAVEKGLSSWFMPFRSA
jgi:hypothetical protein